MTAGILEIMHEDWYPQAILHSVTRTGARHPLGGAGAATFGGVHSLRAAAKPGQRGGSRQSRPATGAGRCRPGARASWNLGEGKLLPEPVPERGVVFPRSDRASTNHRPHAPQPVDWLRP